MEDLAKWALVVTIPCEVLEVTFPHFIETDQINPPFPVGHVEPLYQKVKLFSKPNSPELNSILRMHIEAIWKQVIKPDGQALTNEENTALSFLSAGAVVTIGANADISFLELLSLAQGSIGKAVHSIFQNFKE